MSVNKDRLVDAIYTVFHKIVSLGYDEAMISFEDVYACCEFIMLYCSNDEFLKTKYLETLSLYLNQSNMQKNTICDLFSLLGKLNINLQIFFDFLISKNIGSIDELFHSFDTGEYISLHSTYLRSFYARRYEFDLHPEIENYIDQLTEPTSMVVHNLCKFIQMKVPIEISESSNDLAIYADIIHNLSKKQDQDQKQEFELINNFYNSQLQRIQKINGNVEKKEEVFNIIQISLNFISAASLLILLLAMSYMFGIIIIHIAKLLFDFINFYSCYYFFLLTLPLCPIILLKKLKINYLNQ
jgi:hypothetical protein